MDDTTMYRLIASYLEHLPRVLKEVAGEDGSVSRHSIYPPHSLHATIATLLLDADVDMARCRTSYGKNATTD